jgi:hypothetical protein
VEPVERETRTASAPTDPATNDNDEPTAPQPAVEPSKEPFCTSPESNGACGVTAFEAADSTPVPTAFVALTVNV